LGLLGLMFRLNAPNVYMVKENCHSKMRRRELLYELCIVVFPSDFCAGTWQK